MRSNLILVIIWLISVGAPVQAKDNYGGGTPFKYDPVTQSGGNQHRSAPSPSNYGGNGAAIGKSGGGSGSSPAFGKGGGGGGGGAGQGRSHAPSFNPGGGKTQPSFNPSAGKAHQPQFGNHNKDDAPRPGSDRGKSHKEPSWQGSKKQFVSPPSSEKPKHRKELTGYGVPDKIGPRPGGDKGKHGGKPPEKPHGGQGKPEKKPPYDPKEAKHHKPHYDYYKRRRHRDVFIHDDGPYIDIVPVYGPDAADGDLIEPAADPLPPDENVDRPGPRASERSAWSVHTHNEASGETTCIAVSYAETVVAERAGTQAREAAISLIDRPKRGIRQQFNARLEYAPKPASEPIAIVDSKIFNLAVSEDRIFAPDPNTEKKLVEAMKDGVSLTIRSDAPDGSLKDVQFSLIGLTAALYKLQETCRP